MGELLGEVVGLLVVGLSLGEEVGICVCGDCVGLEVVGLSLGDLVG